MRAFVLIGIAIALTIHSARGDTPLPPPSKITATSPNGHIRAISDPKSGTWVEDFKQHKVLWRLPDWHRAMFVANDGKHLVTEYDGLNFIPTNFSDELVLLTFWREGVKIREVRVRDLFPDHRKLERTESHYYWGHIDGIDASGRLKLERADGKTILFGVTTGNKT